MVCIIYVTTFLFSELNTKATKSMLDTVVNILKTHKITIHLNQSRTPMTACDNKRKPYDEKCDV